MKENFVNWKEIWKTKGNTNSDDLKALDGFENQQFCTKRFAERFKNRILFKNTDKILEVGCGAGMISNMLDCEYYGVDYSPSLVTKHKKLLGKPHIYCTEAKNINFPDNFFDTVFCYSVSQYFPNKTYFLTVENILNRISKKIIYWGDIPHSSSEENHLLYSDCDFIGYQRLSPLYSNSNGTRFDYIKFKT